MVEHLILVFLPFIGEVDKFGGGRLSSLHFVQCINTTGSKTTPENDATTTTPKSWYSVLGFERLTEEKFNFTTVIYIVIPRTLEQNAKKVAFPTLK